MTQEPDFRALCAKLIDRWTKGKGYWTVLAEIESALAYDPRNDESYDTYSYGTEPLPYDTTWAQTKAPDS